jgi:site-specific recombinase XerD
VEHDGTPIPDGSGDHGPALVPLTPVGAIVTAFVPDLLRHDGEGAVRAYVEFFVARLRCENTRVTYGAALLRFCLWCQERGLGLRDLRPAHVGLYIHHQHPGAIASRKLALAAIASFGRHLVARGVLDRNPADGVEGPRLVVLQGKTYCPSAEEIRRLLDAIPTDSGVGLRDRALISVMLYTFGRVSAVLGLDRQDLVTEGAHQLLCLHEKGGKQLRVPLHHKAREALHGYLEAVDIADGEPLFQSVRRDGRLSGRRLTRQKVGGMVKRRARQAGISARISPHSFRAAGITLYRAGGGSLAHAQQIAGHASVRSTRLYDRTQDRINLEEIERIRLD